MSTKPENEKPELPAEARELLEKVAVAAFPGGSQQIEEESAQLHALLRGRLSEAEARELLTKTKTLLVVVKDKSETSILQIIEARTSGKLTRDEARLVYQFLTDAPRSER
jgi:chemotaxis regulatin CheY-phosphate phosphatase CheZ